jgi:H+/Cl- antiporter ClcA
MPWGAAKRCAPPRAGNVNAILDARPADYAPLLLLQIVAAKITTTAVCRGAGLVGGIYAPSIFIGALPG